MLRKIDRWVRGHRKTSVAIALAVVLVTLNFLSYRHAFAMTHFVKAGAATPGLAKLTWAEKVNVLVFGVRIPKPLNSQTPRNVGLPFDVHTFRSADGTKLESWYIPRTGAKGLVLIFHGYIGCKGRYLREAAAFHDMGYATFLTDFRGSGGSDGYETTIGALEADDVAAAVAYAHEKWPELPQILYGQSMGSVAVLRGIAIHGLRPEAIIIENPFNRLTSTVANRFKVMGLPSFPFAQLLVFWGGVQCGFNGFEHNPVDYAREVHCPALVIHGDKDRLVTSAEAEEVFDALASSRKIFKLVPAGHQSLFGANPQAWKQATRDFLDAK